MLKEAVTDKPMSKHKCMSGLIISKEVKYLLKTNNVVAPLSRVEMTKILKSSPGCPWRLLSDHWWNFWSNRCVRDFMSTHFNGRFVDETGCCKICDLPWFAGRAQRWPLVSHKSCIRWWDLVLRLQPPSHSSNQVSGSHQIRPGKKIARQVRSSLKTKLIYIFYVDGIVHREFVSPGQRANQKFYLNVLKSLRKSLQRNHPEKWQSGEWFLQHDNAPAHTNLSVQHFLAKNKILVEQHHTTPLTRPRSLQLFCRHGWSRFWNGGVLLMLQKFNENQ